MEGRGKGGKKEEKVITQSTYFKQDESHGMIQDEPHTLLLEAWTLRSGLSQPGPLPHRFSQALPSTGSWVKAKPPPTLLHQHKPMLSLNHPWQSWPAEGKPSEGALATLAASGCSAGGSGLDAQFVGQGGLSQTLGMGPWDRASHPGRQPHGINSGCQ